MTIELERAAQPSRKTPASLLRILMMGFSQTRVLRLQRAATTLAQIDVRIESIDDKAARQLPSYGRRHDIVIVSAALATQWFADAGDSTAATLARSTTTIVGGKLDAVVTRRALRRWGFSQVLDIERIDAALFLKIAIMASLQRMRSVQTELVRDALASLNGTSASDAMEPLVIVDDSHRIRFANTAAQNLPAATLSRLVRDILLSPWPPVEVIIEDLEHREEVDLPDAVVATRAMLGEERMMVLVLRSRVAALVEPIDESSRDVNPLTGLPSRDTFIRSVSTDLAAAEPKSCGGMLLINLRGLQKFSEAVGLPVGGSMVAAVVHRIRNRLRTSSLLGHVADDTFAAWINDAVDAQELRDFAGHLLAELQSPFVIDSSIAELTVSIGISICPDDGTDVSMLLSHADMALRRAQRRGSGQVELFDTRGGRCITRRDDRFDELHRAFERDEFRVVFQPEFDGSDTRLAGAETLLRWTDADGRAHAPSEFVPLLEQSGLMSAIGDRTLREACNRARSWRGCEGADLRVSVNLSPQQLLDRGFASRLTSILSETGLPADRLELEISESSFLQHTDAAAARLHDLADLGVRVLIDDFGTGLSPISYLKSLPLSGIKIDRCFISGIEHNPRDRALIQAMIDLAMSLGLSVVGEGVESVLQALRLQQMGIGRLQGYLFAPGLTSDEFAERFLQP